MRKVIAVYSYLAVLLMTACSANDTAKINATAAKVEPQLQSACTAAMTLANIAGLVPGVGAIVPYLNAGCGTAEGIAKLAADPASTEWVGTLEGQIKTLASNAGRKL